MQLHTLGAGKSHEARQVWVPPPEGQGRVAPGMQLPCSPMQGPNSPKTPVTALHTRVCVPHIPQERVGAPSQLRAALQTPLSQTLPALQSPSTLQGLQLPWPLQTWGLHVLVVLAEHEPPRQVVMIELLFMSQRPEQTAPAASPSEQAARPSQVPVFPHVSCDGAHPPCGGLWPAGTGAQVPVSQASQSPRHADLQQTVLRQHDRPPPV